MSLVVDKFLRYISFDTQSEDEQEQQPSTQSSLHWRMFLRMNCGRWELRK